MGTSLRQNQHRALAQPQYSFYMDTYGSLLKIRLSKRVHYSKDSGILHRRALRFLSKQHPRCQHRADYFKHTQELAHQQGSHKCILLAHKGGAL